MLANIEYEYILLLGYSILYIYKEYNLTRFNHQKKSYSHILYNSLYTHYFEGRGQVGGYLEICHGFEYRIAWELALRVVSGVGFERGFRY